MAAHRYWRIRNHANGSGQTGIGEVEFAATYGGADQCSGGTAIASGSYGGGYESWRAFDDNTSTNWFQNDGQNYEGAWIGYDFGSGNDVEVNEVRIVRAPEESSATPRIFYVESSDDNSTWSYEYTGFIPSYADGTPVAFQRPASQPSNRHWGVFSLRHSIGGARDIVVSELQMRTSIGGADQCSGGTPSCYPENASAASLFDDNTGTILYSASTDRPVMMAYDFGSNISIQEIAITSGTDGGFSNQFRAPRDGFLMYSQDGRGWQRCGEFVDQEYGNYETKAFLIEGVTPPPAAPRRKLIVAN